MAETEFPGDPSKFTSAAKTTEPEKTILEEIVEEKKPVTLCSICGTAFPLKPNKIYCGAECRDKASEQRKRRRGADPAVSPEVDAALKLPKVKITLQADPSAETGRPYLCGVIGDNPVWNCAVGGISFSRSTYQIIRDEEGNGKIGTKIPAHLTRLTQEQAQRVLDNIVYKFVRPRGNSADIVDARAISFVPSGDLRPLSEYLVMTPAEGVSLLNAQSELNVPTISKLYAEDNE